LWYFTQRAQAARIQTVSKRCVLCGKKTVNAQRQTKAAIEAQIIEIQKGYQHAEAELRRATAEELRKAAAQLEKAS
jgi:hypothetical protein